MDIVRNKLVLLQTFCIYVQTLCGTSQPSHIHDRIRGVFRSLRYTVENFPGEYLHDAQLEASAHEAAVYAVNSADKPEWLIIAP